MVMSRDLLLTDGEVIHFLSAHIASGIENRIIFGKQIAQAQFAKVQEHYTGYLSPEEAEGLKEAIHEADQRWTDLLFEVDATIKAKVARLFQEIQEHFDKSDLPHEQYLWLLEFRKREGQ